MIGKKLVTLDEENALVQTIINYACKHQFTVTNIIDAVNKVMTYMADNAVLETENCTCDEIQSSDQTD